MKRFGPPCYLWKSGLVLGSQDEALTTGIFRRSIVCAISHVGR